MGLQHLDILFDNKSFPDFQKCFCYVIIQFKMNDFIWYFRSNSTRRANILKQRSRSPDSDMLLISSAISRTMFKISFIGSFFFEDTRTELNFFRVILGSALEVFQITVAQIWRKQLLHSNHFCKKRPEGSCKSTSQLKKYPRCDLRHIFVL